MRHFALIVLLCCVGCFKKVEKDPDKDDLTKGNNFDPKAVHGVVTQKRVGTFVNHERATANGVPPDQKSYYCVTITATTGANRLEEETCGINRIVFDELDVGKILPLRRSDIPMITKRKELARVQGVVREKYINTYHNLPTILVEHNGTWEAHYIEHDVYQKDIRPGMELPLPLPVGGQDPPSEQTPPEATR